MPSLDSPNDVADAARSVRVEQVEHAVLQHLGERDQVGELAVVESGQDGVGDVADAGLDRAAPAASSGADLWRRKSTRCPAIACGVSSGGRNGALRSGLASRLQRRPCPGRRAGMARRRVAVPR